MPTATKRAKKAPPTTKAKATPAARPTKDAISVAASLTHAQVGEFNVRMGTPKSIALRYDLAQAAQTNPLRAQAAALGMCWEAGGTAKPPAQWSRFNCDPMAYGGAVIDELSRRGVPLGVVVHAGQVAFIHMMKDLPTQEEVAAHEDFSEARPEV